MSIRLFFSVLAAFGVFAICGTVCAQTEESDTRKLPSVAADSQPSAPGVVSEQQSAAQLAEYGAAPAPSSHAVGDEQQTQPVWYGWQTLVADGAAGALIAVGLLTEDYNQDLTIAIVTLGGATYVFGAPVVHALHGRAGTAFADFGVRVGAPIGGALTGAIIAVNRCPEPEYTEDDRQANCQYAGFFLGLLVGIGSAIVIDSAVFARESQRAPRVKSARGLSVTPSLSITPYRSELKFSGTF